jgi:hypothetical protein
MMLSRRELVVGSAAGALVPLGACRAAARGGQVAPENFGAIGDGIADDYPAFQRLADAVNNVGSGTVALRPRATYFLNRYVAPDNGVKDVVFRRCSGLVVQGNGATLAVKGDYFRQAPTTRGLAGLMFADCRDVEVHDLQLVGNVQRTRRMAGLAEAPAHGLVFYGCSDVTVDGVLARHFSADGLYIDDSRTADVAGRHGASRRFTVRNSRFLFNARQGLSVIQLRDAVFERCEFSYTGYIDMRSSQGPYRGHAPLAGVDIEPDATPFTTPTVDVLTGNISFRNCRMIGNLGATFIACQVSNGLAAIENVTVKGCTLETSQGSTSQYGLIFDVPGGAITGSMVRMRNKIAYLGWSPQSRANPKFMWNTVSGDSAGPGRFFFVVLDTRGAPVVERNRFIVQRVLGGPSGAASQAVRNENSRAVVRDNQFVIRS